MSYGPAAQVLGPERRRRWSKEAKAAIVAETYAPGVSVSEVARRHGIAPSQVFAWRKLAEGGALQAIGGGDPVIADREAQALRQRIRDLERLLGRKTPENEILKEAIEIARSKKLISRAPLFKDMGPGEDER
jgi:transposase